jgi:hypothetical protein
MYFRVPALYGYIQVRFLLHVGGLAHGERPRSREERSLKILRGMEFFLIDNIVDDRSLWEFSWVLFHSPSFLLS